MRSASSDREKIVKISNAVKNVLVDGCHFADLFAVGGYLVDWPASRRQRLAPTRSRGVKNEPGRSKDFLAATYSRCRQQAFRLTPFLRARLLDGVFVGFHIERQYLARQLCATIGVAAVVQARVFTVMRNPLGCRVNGIADILSLRYFPKSESSRSFGRAATRDCSRAAPGHQ